VAVQQPFLVVQRLGLQASQHALQRQVRRRWREPGRGSRAVRQHMGHAAIGERPHELRIAGERGCLVVGASVTGEQPVVGVQQIGGHEPVEQVADAAAASAGRYQRRSAPCGA